MATYTGDATITNFTSASGTRSASSGIGTTVYYTAPAGTFAEVLFISASGNTGSNNAGYAYIGGVTVLSVGESSAVSASFGDFSQPIWLNEGETVGVTFTETFGGTSTISISARVKEYNKP